MAQARRELAVAQRRDITQGDVAKAIGVTAAAVSQWESGDRSPREEALAKLAEFLGVTPAYLRYGVGAEESSRPPMAKGKTVAQVIAERDAGTSKKKPPKTA